MRNWLLERAIDPGVALEAGVRYDPNRDALLFPRVGMDHMPYGWKVRHLVGGKTYNDSSGISVVDCEPWTVMDGGGDTLCICEGETDALCLATNIQFFPELKGARIIAVPGANVFPNEWAGMFSGYDKVFLFPDPDSAGEQMADKVCGLIARTKVVKLDPKVGDLNDNIKNNLGGVWDALRTADYRYVQTKLRRTSYNFKRSYDFPNHLIVEVALKDTKLKRRGREYYGRCPLHEDTDPSFSVDPKKGVFYCHGCEKGGDIIEYFRQRDGLSFKRAKARAESLCK